MPLFNLHVKNKDNNCLILCYKCFDTYFNCIIFVVTVLSGNRLSGRIQLTEPDPDVGATAQLGLYCVTADSQRKLH